MGAVVVLRTGGDQFGPVVEGSMVGMIGADVEVVGGGIIGVIGLTMAVGGVTTGGGVTGSGGVT